jgi:hypothetical protein
LWSVVNAGWFSLLVGTIVGLLGIWLGYIFYKRSRQVSRLRYLLGDAPIIEPAPTDYGDGLEVRFDGNIVERVTRTSFGLWNDGTTTIVGSDIVEADPLRLELRGNGEMFRVTVEGATRTVNGAWVCLAATDQATLGFDYLDPGDGFRIQVLHSGELRTIEIKGTVRGIPMGVLPFQTGRAVQWLVFGVLGLMSLIAMVGTLLVVGAVIARAAIDISVHRSPPGYYFWFFVLAALVTGLLMRWLLRASARRHGPIRIKGVPSAITEDASLNPWSESFGTDQNDKGARA